MVKVAVIGGTGSVGKTIVDALKESPKHEVVIISRRASCEPDSVPVRIIPVDYNDIPAMTKTLEEHQIHTIISTIVMMHPDSAASERNFIAAADASKSTKRFIASGWGSAIPEEEALRLPFNAHCEQSLEALRKTDLDWSRIQNSMFLDYYGMPHVDTHLLPMFFALDIANKRAAIPGTSGEEVMSLTYTKDLAKFVVAALDLPKWEETMHCYSDFTSFKDMVAMAEEATGSKFEVTYDPVEKLYAGQVTELPSHPYLYPYFPKEPLQGLLAKFGLWIVKGPRGVDKKRSLNEKFPEIQTMTVKEMIDLWKGK